jgi:hypothetical protein
MNSRSSELTSGNLFPLRRPSTVVGMPERCSAPFRRISTCDGRLPWEHLSDSGSDQWSMRKMLTAPAFSWKSPTIRSVLRSRHFHA